MTTRSHLLFGAFLLLFGVLGHWNVLFERGALIDEEFYESGITALEVSGSAYQAEGFMYPPTFAAGGLWLQERLGVNVVRVVFRWLNFASLIFVLWFTARCYTTSATSRQTEPASHVGHSVHEHPVWLAALALLLTRAPGVHLGLYVGNISFLVGALVLVGFWLVDRRPVFAGTLLALSLLIKPLAAGALPLLLLRQDRAGISLRRWLAAATAGIGSLLVLWFFRSELPAMFATEMTSMAKNRSLSLYRISRLLGLGELRLPIFAITTGVLCLWFWQRLSDRRRLLVGALVMIPLTTLAVWSHTLVLFFPVCALAARRLVDRRTHRARCPGQVRWLRLLPSDPRVRMEMVLVVGGLALVYFVHSGGYPQLHPLLQILLLSPPLLAPLALTLYWFKTDRLA